MAKKKKTAKKQTALKNPNVVKKQNVVKKKKVVKKPKATKKSTTHSYLGKLRRLAKSLPETSEQETWDHPTFRVKDKIFASFGMHEGKPTIGCKQTKEEQLVLLEDERFFFAPYVGKHGWIGIWIDTVEWDFVAELVEDSYRLIAPKTLVRKLDAQSE